MTPETSRRRPAGEARRTEGCACFKARRAARAITRLYDETLEPCGLRTPQFAILTVIRSRGSITMQALASDLALDPSTMTRTLQPLLEGRFVRVGRAEDRRVRELVLTPRGRKTLEQAHRLWGVAQQRLRASLGGRRFLRFLSDLDAVAKALKD